jgi:polysaccharide export outer membrane protein
MLRHTLIFSALVTIFFVVSCSAPKKAIYFRNDDHPDTVIARQEIAPVTDVVVQNDDILAINVTSSSLGQENPLHNIFNEGGTPYSITPTSQMASNPVHSGYLVDKDGFFDFPVIGRTKASGRTIREIKDKLADTLKHYITSPVVEVRIINYKVTVMGEVARPGTVIAPNHKINILEALATSGDIPVTGRKDNVMVIREQNGKREFVTLNLNSRTLFNSPYFNLKQNDVIYVEPSRVRRSETNEFIRVYLPIISTVISTALTAYAISTVKR